MLGSATTAASGVKVSSRILERYLLRGEDIVVATRQHWAQLAEPVLTALVGFVVVSWLSATLEAATGYAALWLYWGWLALVARLLWELAEWRNEWFVATDKRLLMTYGLFTHKVAMMPLGKVTDMNYGRSVLGRFVGYGTFTMESAGQDQAMHRINWVPDPDNTYRSICDIIFVPDRHDDEDNLPERDQDDRWPSHDHQDQDQDQDETQPDQEGTDRFDRPRWSAEDGAEPDPGWEVSPSGDSAYMPVAVRGAPRRDPPDA